MASTLPRAERISNRHLVWDGGNQYVPVRAYFTVPNWWRRFIFTILSPRDFTIYAYICSQSDEHGIAYPTYQNIKADLNLTNARVIKASLDKLNDCGFLLVRRIAPLKMNRHPRNVYQRPSIEYTLRQLLDKRYIDTEFRPLKPRPTAAAVAGQNPNWNNGSLRYGLRELLGPDRYTTWARTAPDSQRAVLIDLLQSIINEKKIRYDLEVRPTLDPQATRDSEEQIGDSDGPTLDEYIENFALRPLSASDLEL